MKFIPSWTREQKSSVLHLLCDPDLEPPSFASHNDLIDYVGVTLVN